MSNHTAGRFVWHELVTPDPKAAAGFYGELFGWTTSEKDMGPGGAYTIFSADKVEVAGGIAPPKGAKVPPSWLAYATVPDVDAAAATATKHGATIMAPPMDIPGVGRFAVVVDAQGAVLAPFKPATTRADSNDTPPVGHFCWDDLATKDPAAALKLYEAVYGWTHQDKDMGPMGTYHLLLRGDKMAAGIMKTRMAEQPSAWLSYVHVKDVDERTGKVPGLKGNVIVPPTDIPGIGRFSVVTDKQGAVLALFTGSM